MSIQKKSLLSSLNTTKKAIVASTPATPTVESGTRAASARPAVKLATRAAAKLATRAAVKLATRNATRLAVRNATRLASRQS
jgi:hypothetical protein